MNEWMNSRHHQVHNFFQHPTFHLNESFLSHLELWRSGDSCKCRELFTARHCLNWPETIQPLLLVNVILWLHLLIFSSQNDHKVLFPSFYTSSLLMRNNWKFIVIFLVKYFMYPSLTTLFYVLITTHTMTRIPAYFSLKAW